MSWKLTDGLTNLRNQVNARFPDRDHASDGTIGDTAHMAETSGHNPDDTAGSKPEWDGDPDSTPEVRAWDMDSGTLGDPSCNAQDVVDHIRHLSGLASVIRYMIYNRLMYHERDGFEPTPYDGSSAHTEHIHFSGAWSQAADNNTTFDYRLDEVGHMALDDDDASTVWEHDGITNPAQRPDSPLHTPPGTNVNTHAAYALGDVWRLVYNTRDAVNALDDKVEALSAQQLPADLAEQVAALVLDKLGARIVNG